MTPLGQVGLWTLGIDRLPIAQIRETAAEVEELGYGCLWIPDFVGREPFITAAHLLSATTTLCVGTAVVNIHGREPFATAAAHRTLEADFPGRFFLGLGVSHAPLVQALFDKEYVHPVDAMRSYLDRLDAAYPLITIGSSTPELQENLQVGQGDDAAEASAVPPLPRFIAGNGPLLLKLAGTHASGVIPTASPLEQTTRARQAVGPDRLVISQLTVVLEERADEARRRAREYLAATLSLPNYVNNLKRIGYSDADLADGGTDQLIDDLVIWGDLDTIRGRVHAHLDAGADHVPISIVPVDQMNPDTYRELAKAVVAR